MIVIAIIGILAAIAVPSYSDYIIRSRASEMLASVSGLKQGMAEYRVIRGAFPASLSEAGADDPADYSDVIDSVTVVIAVELF